LFQAKTAVECVDVRKRLLHPSLRRPCNTSSVCPLAFCVPLTSVSAKFQLFVKCFTHLEGKCCYRLPPLTATHVLVKEYNQINLTLALLTCPNLVSGHKWFQSDVNKCTSEIIESLQNRRRPFGPSSLYRPQSHPGPIPITPHIYLANPP